MPSRELTAYITAAMGLGCAVAAAAIQGGIVPALSAAGAGLLSLAGFMGYSAKAPAVTK